MLTWNIIGSDFGQVMFEIEDHWFKLCAGYINMEDHWFKLWKSYFNMDDHWFKPWVGGVILHGRSLVQAMGGFC